MGMKIMFMGKPILFWLKTMNRKYSEAVPLYSPVYTRVFPIKGLPEYNSIRNIGILFYLHPTDYHTVIQCTIFNCTQGTSPTK